MDDDIDDGVMTGTTSICPTRYIDRTVMELPMRAPTTSNVNPKQTLDCCFSCWVSDALGVDAGRFILPSLQTRSLTSRRSPVDSSAIVAEGVVDVVVVDAVEVFDSKIAAHDDTSGGI